jgi:dGTPase
VNWAISDATQLAPYAQSSEASRGRRHPEPRHDYRSPYQRDRDRIVHSRAFRRLEYKTQVFVNDEGDHYRTRLTHTIEVSQIGRTVARALRINEDLVESLALSHDLGHTPFGHLGEEVLDDLLAAEGGFNHNRQSLRIVEHLEDRYPDFPGLNLTWEVREGIAKHSGPIDTNLAPEFQEYRPDLQPPLEAQLIDLVDEIAYNHHDVDDGLDSGLIDIEDLASEVSLFGDPLRRACREHTGATDRQLHTAALRGMIDRLVSDLIATTRDRVERSGVATVDDVRQLGEQLVGLSEGARTGNAVLKAFLRDKLYHHQRIERTKDESRRMLRALFSYYMDNEHLLPADAQLRAAREGRARVVADHVAGMTDRYASDEHRRLSGPTSSA